MSDAMSDAVTVTICGAPSRDTLSALLDVAVSAGLGFILQPRALAQAPPPAPIEVESRPLKVRRAKKAKRPAAAAPPAVTHKLGYAALAAVPASLAAALKAAPLKVAEIEARHGVSRFQLRSLVQMGLLVATGRTVSRRYGLPHGPSGAAKEVP